jgi:hypothetical protein
MFTVWVRMGAKHNAVSMAGKSWNILRAKFSQYVLDLRLQAFMKDLVEQGTGQ